MTTETTAVQSPGDPPPEHEPSVILITGAMAAGKSTVAQLFAERFRRSVHVRGDTFRRFIVNGRVDPTAEITDDARQQLMLRYRLAVTVADAYAEAGFTAVMQDVVAGPFLPDVISMVQTPTLYVVVLDPGAKAISEREAARGKSGYGAAWSPAQFVDSFRATTPRVGLWLDTSDLDAEQTVAAIAQRLEEARVRGPETAG